MTTLINTNRLILKVENQDKAQSILNFYIDNKNFFEMYEPTRPDNFYTLAYQYSAAIYEYQEILRHRTLRYYVYLNSDPDTIIGSVNFSNIYFGSFLKTCIGYKFHKDYQHMGYASEAVSAALDVIFHEYGMVRIEAHVLPDNESSIHLLTKLGFKYEGLEYSYANINNERKDHLRYSLIQLPQ